jgi:DNA-binding NtrC family response regulator
LFNQTTPIGALKVADSELALNNSSVQELAQRHEETQMSNFIALVVEDDALQREIVSELLGNNGLEVVTCSTAEAAELVLASTGTELRALVTDVNLGGAMSGVELAEYAKRRFPRLNVVMVSGKGPPYVPQDTHFFLKPYLPDDLLRAVLH